MPSRMHSPETARDRRVRRGSSEFLRGSSCSSGPDGTAAVVVRGRGQADNHRVAAHRAGPFLAVAVRHIGTGRRLRVKLLEQPLLVASGAVPARTGPARTGPARPGTAHTGTAHTGTGRTGTAQLRHPGNLLGAVRHGACGS